MHDPSKAAVWANNAISLKVLENVKEVCFEVDGAPELLLIFFDFSDVD
jgi:hypothetical protein